MIDYFNANKFNLIIFVITTLLLKVEEHTAVQRQQEEPSVVIANFCKSPEIRGANEAVGLCAPEGEGL